MGQYTEQCIRNEFNEAIKEPNLLYTKKFVNYTGNIKGEKRPYADLVAELVLDKMDKFESGLSIIERENFYNTDSHKGDFNLNSPREEENLAKKMFWISKHTAHECFGELGQIIDYQTPLKNVQVDQAGKIDLLAYNDKQNILRLIEFKRFASDESILRAIMEAYTYLKSIGNTLLSDFNLPNDTKAMPAVLIYEDSKIHRHLQKDCPYVHKLIKMWEVEVYLITNEFGEYLKDEPRIIPKNDEDNIKYVEQSKKFNGCGVIKEK